MLENGKAVKTAWIGLVAALAAGCLMLSGCKTLLRQSEQVVITASAAEVSDCTRVGPVILGTVDSEFDLRQRELRMQTVRRGGNVLLVNSFASATDGMAYACDAPIDPRRAAS